MVQKKKKEEEKNNKTKTTAKQHKLLQNFSREITFFVKSISTSK
jgi:hypothetical protein